MYIISKKKGEKGFTLIELLVVIAIIGLLSSVVLAGLNEARAKSRDTRRKADLVQIRNALLLYYDKNGNYIETASGCGSGGSGNGFFNYTAGYPASIVSCLITSGFLASEIIDPTGGRTSTPTAGYSYMKYHCVQGGQTRVYILAKLETVAQSATAADATCAPTLDTVYGMNYYLLI